MRTTKLTPDYFQAEVALDDAVVFCEPWSTVKRYVRAPEEYYVRSSSASKAIAIEWVRTAPSMSSWKPTRAMFALARAAQDDGTSNALSTSRTKSQRSKPCSP